LDYYLKLASDLGLNFAPYNPSRAVLSFIAGLPSSVLDFSVRNKTYHNLSNRTLPGAVADIIGLGWNFIPTPRPLLPQSILKSFIHLVRAVKLDLYFNEQGARPLPLYRHRLRLPSTWTPELEDPVINSLIPFVKSVLKPYSGAPTSNIPTPKLLAYKKFLEDRSFTICQADKNMGTVVMDSSDYDAMAWVHLLDTDTYVPLTIADAHRLCRIFKARTLSLLVKTFGEEYSSNTVFRFIVDSFSTASSSSSPFSLFAKFKLLIKLHKTPTASRPLCCSIGSVTYNASKALHAWLAPVVLYFTRTSGLIADSSRSTVYDLERRPFPAGVVLCSFDITALYPSIPIVDALEAISVLVHEYVTAGGRLDFPADNLVTLLRLVLETNIVNYNGRLFRQIKGGAMGTPVFVAVAVLFMFYIERSLVSTAMVDNSCLYFRRFIDDIIAVFASEQQAIDFWKQYNSLHTDIKATGTTGESVVWLDLVVFKGLRFSATGIVDFRVYQKDLNLYLYLPFYSCHPYHSKVAFISAECRRYVICCSDELDYIKVRDLFVSRLRSRAYPFCIIKKAVLRISYKLRQEYLSKGLVVDYNISDPLVNDLDNPAANNNNSKAYHLIIQHNPYHTISGTFDALRRMWSTLRSYSEYPELFSSPARVAYSNPDTLGQLISKAYASRFSL